MTFRISVTHAVQLIAACSVIGLTVWAWLRKCDRRKKKNRLFLTQKISIHMVCKPEEWEIISPQFHREVKEMKVIGLDCEWVLERKVALLQLSTDTGMCVLLRMHSIGLEIPNSLRHLLSDKSILKVGVAVNDDAKRLLHDHSLAVCGCVDLRHILHRVRGIYHCHSWGLQGLAQAVLDVSITKDPSVRCGDWEAPVLSPEQMEYAAADAMVAVEIFRHLVLAKLLGADPRLNQDAAQNVSQDMFWSCARSLCQGITDFSYIRFHTSAQSFHRKSPQDLDKKWSGKAYTARKRPLWDNCRLLAPDGQLLCTCDFRKATWYIDKDLGKKVCDNPLTVELNFEPSNRPASDRNYYLQDKENMCVVCGAREGYIRKFIIPQEYRKYFPVAFKEHSSHDVLLMCPPCHKCSSDFDTELRLQLVQQCNAPLDSGSNSHILQDRDLQDVRSAARALKKSKSQIPEGRVQQLERILLGFYGVPSLTPDLLETAANIDIKVTRGKVMKHGEKVVRYMMEHGGGLLEFQKLWRHHFLRTMQPEWLPPLWSVEHSEERWGQALGLHVDGAADADHERLKDADGGCGTDGSGGRHSDEEKEDEEEDVLFVDEAESSL